MIQSYLFSRALAFAILIGALIGAPPAHAGGEGISGGGGGGGFPPSSFTGDPMGAGYNLTTGNLYIAAAASLQFPMPFSVSFDITAPSVSTTTLQGAIDTTVANTGFLIAVNGPATVDTDFKLQSAISPSATTACTGGRLCTRASWISAAGRHHVCSIWTASHAWLYVDGVLRDESVAAAGTFTASTGNWTIGANFAAGTILNDLRVYSRALSSDECSQLNTANGLTQILTSGSATTNMAVHLRFDDCVAAGVSSTNCPDTSGNGNTASNYKDVEVATVTNAPATVSGTVNLTATCTDPNGLTCSNVCFFADAVQVGCDSTSPFSVAWDSTKTLDKAHAITAQGQTPSGIAGPVSAAVSLTTNNSVTATNYYFDPVGGSDSNNCTSTITACQTENKLRTLTFLGGDTINLMGGAWSWNKTFNLCGPASGCTETPNQNFYPSGIDTLTITYYGGGTCNPFGVITGCPNITLAAGVGAGLLIFNGSNVTVDHLAMIGSAATLTGFCNVYTTTNNNGGVAIGAVAVGTFSKLTGITIQNNSVQDFSCGAAMNYHNGIALATNAINNYLISGNVIFGSTATTTGVQAISIGPSQGHITGNLVYNYGGQNGTGNCVGVQNWPDSAVATLVDFNVCHTFGYNNVSCGGPTGFATFSADNVAFRFNEAYDSKYWNYPPKIGTSCDWDPFDIDLNSSNILMEYNYGHDAPEGTCLLTVNSFQAGPYNQRWDHNTVRYNICENNGYGFGIRVNLSSALYIYNNTVSTNVGDATRNFYGACIEVNGDSDTVFVNNLCMQTAANVFAPVSYVAGSVPHLVIDYNAYWGFGQIHPWFYGSARTFAQWQSVGGFDAHGLNVNPTIAGTAPAGSCGSIGGPNSCAAIGNVYKLLTGSPMIGVGLNLTGAPYSQNVGTTDFWGTTIPNGVGTGYNIGADGAHH